MFRMIIILLATVLFAGCASKGKVNDLELLLSDARIRVQALEEENNSMRLNSTDSFTGLRGALVELNRRTGELESTHALIRGDFAKLQTGVADAVAESGKHVVELNELHEQLKPISGDLVKFHADYEKTQKALAGLQTEYGRQLREMQNRIEEAELALKALDAQVADSNSESDRDLEMARADTAERIENLNTQLLSFQNETSNRFNDMKNALNTFGEGVYQILRFQREQHSQMTQEYDDSLSRIESYLPGGASEAAAPQEAVNP